jgi:very-short-patch-repair endonuclease
MTPLNILIIIIVLVLFIIISRLEQKNKVSLKSDSDNGNAIDWSNYSARDSFFNSSEKMLYKILQDELGEKYNILSKVRVEDLIESSSKSYSYRNRIKSSHIDFVLLDKNTYKIVSAIELDGASHNNHSAEQKDGFKDELFKKVNIPLHRISVGSDFVGVIKGLNL